MLTTFAKSFPWRGWVTVAVLASAPVLECAAQDDDLAFHAAYAAMFGTGVYRLSDGTEAEVYRGNFSKRLRAPPSEGGAGPGLRLLLPVTVGQQKRGDGELSLDVPTERVKQAAFLPGIELEFAPAERWTLRTRAQAGRSWQLDGAELEGVEPSARLAAFGVRSRLMWSDAPGRPALINGLLWASVDPSDAERDSLLRFTTALEASTSACRVGSFAASRCACGRTCCGIGTIGARPQSRLATTSSHRWARNGRLVSLPGGSKASKCGSSSSRPLALPTDSPTTAKGSRCI